MTATLHSLETAPDLVDRVHRALRDAICDGSLAAGSRITQEDIAERLAVSRQPVLQALRLLKRDGFVLDAPGRGVLVAPLDPLAVTHLYQVRGALDALAAQLAASQHHQLDPALLRQGRDATERQDVRAMIDADLAFHSAIYRASGNPMLEQAAQLHWAHLRRIMGAVLSATHQRQTIWDEHQAIAEAIAQGDGPLAASLLQDHSAQAGRHLARRLSDVLADTTANAKGDTA